MSLETYRVGNHDCVPAEPDPYDPRGLLWVWEEPHPSATYVIGVDPTVGLTGWHRLLRTRDDTKTDNAAVEVIRVGGRDKPDVQVAEFAAPVDSYDIVPVINLLGRLYAGSHEEGQAHVIIEVYPGPGLTTQRELISRYGYTNLYQQKYLDTLVPTNRRNAPFGWTATRNMVRDLWVKGLHHINAHRVIIRSPWLVEEMSDCISTDDSMAKMRAIYGSHDDRIRAFLLALWAANDWSNVWEPTDNAPAEDTSAPNWQASDITVSAMYDEWEDKFSRLLGDE